MALRRRSAVPSKLACRSAAPRCCRPQVELLESRCLLAADPLLFIEDFSLDSDRSEPGYDSADADPNTPADRLQILHAVSARDTAFLSTTEVLVGSTFQPSELYALGLLGPATDTISLPPEGTAGGLTAGETISAVAIGYSGLGTIRFLGDNGTRTIHVSTPFNLWQSVTVTGNSPSDTGQEVGTIRSVVVSTIELIAIDDIALLVNGIIVNNPPVANPDLATTLPGAPLDIDVLANDSDADGDLAILYTFDRQSEQGGTIQVADGKLRYTPPASFHGVDSFHYAITDNRIPAGSAVQGTVQVTVNTPPPAPIVRIPVPHGYRGPFSFDAAAILAEAIDADGDRLSIASFAAPLLGSLTRDISGTFIYVPSEASGLLLDDQFEFRLSDAFAVGEAGLAFLDPNERPVALDSTTLERRGAPGPFEATLGTDAEGDPLLPILIEQPRHGGLSYILDGPDATGRTSVRFRYDPGPDGFRFNDRFTFQLADDPYGARSDLGTVTILTNNGGPVAQDDEFAVPVGVASPLDVLRNDADADNDPLLTIIATQPQHGRATIRPLDGLVNYEPDPDFQGDDFFTYRATDSDLQSALATVLLTVAGTPEVTAVDDVYVVPYDGLHQSLEHFFPSPFDNDTAPAYYPGDAGFYQAVILSQPRVGSVNDDGSPFELTYPPGFTGPLTFTYGIEFATGDGHHLASNIATVTVNIVDRDSDGDGVLDSVEDASVPLDPNPAVCYSFDDPLGIPTCTRQPAQPEYDAASAVLPNAVDGRYVKLDASLGATLHDVRASADPPTDVPLPQGATFPVGFFSYSVQIDVPGFVATVRMTLPDGINVNSYWKYGPTPDVVSPDGTHPAHWYDFTREGFTGAEFFHVSNGQEINFEEIELNFQDGQRGDDDLLANGVIVEPGGPALVPVSRVASVAVNDGAAQRSMVTSLTVTFDSLVSVQPGAFDLRMSGERKPVDLKVVLSEVNGSTMARLTFKNGRDVIHSSLRDGTYRLTIRGDKIRDASGNLLDGDGDGAAGGDYLYSLFRRFGDTDGDGDVDAQDKRVFQSAFGKRARDAGYLWYLDANTNGRVWAEDLALLLLGYCKSGKKR